LCSTLVLVRVLVAAASRHGATLEIAEEVGRCLAAAGSVDVRELPAADLDVAAYDAVVVGSAVYMGHWLEPARYFVSCHASVLCERPVWLFSSGPVGAPLKPEEDSVDAAPLLSACHAREHRVFPGALTRSSLGFAERAVVAALRVPDGDFRDWDAVRDWAASIGQALQEAALAE
jgi:menaquinone-dependent protoporphyrinogen oxidase